MKTKSRSQETKRGGVLLMAMLVLLAFSVLAVGLHRLSLTTGLDAVYQDHAKQAFWLAESGLQDAIQRLRYDSTFRLLAIGGSRSFTVSNATDSTRYDVTVTDTGTGSALYDRYEFDVVSVGWKRDMNRRIIQRISSQPGFISAIMAPNDIIVDANTLVTGPIMVMDNGQLILDDKIPPGQDLEGDFDIVILDDNASINEKKSNADEGADYDVVDLPVPDDLPEMPNFKSYLDTANLEPVVSGTTNIAVLNLTGDTYFNYPDGITIEKITGSGTIVNTGDITIKGSTVTTDDVSSDVNILSFEDVVVEQKTDFGNNILIYGFETVYFGDHSYVPSKSAILADGGTFLKGTPEDADHIIMGGQSEFMGIIFADEGNVTIEAGSGGADNTRIIGTVICGNSVEMNSNSEIIFDPDVFYDGGLFDLDTFFGTAVVTTAKVWEELPPL
jgi:hypothetical protein